MANEKRKLRAKAIAITTSFFILANTAYVLHDSTLGSYITAGHNKNPKINMEPYDSYCFGDIYIGAPEKIQDLEGRVCPTDILVMDCSNSSSKPEYKIIDSYRVKTFYEKNQILRSIMKYDKAKRKTNWNRTFRSTFFEWIVHNFLYTIHYERDRTTDVDLDNADEEQYKIFTKK